jgi:hypothetical protein
MDGISNTPQSEEGPYQRMLSSLRTTFQQRVPGGLTGAADARLQRSLNHYIKEVIHAHGTIDEQETLRATYDSMTKWYRRNTTQIALPSSATNNSDIAPFSRKESEEENPMTNNVTTNDNPLVLFERMRTARSEPQPLNAVSAVTNIPELKPLETSLRVAADKFRIQAKDIVTPQEDVVKYRETEHNLILNSRDRNWLANTKENRYNFSVVLDSAAREQGTGVQLTIRNRFRNIVRVEFVKAILPVESLETVVPRYCCDGNDTVVETAPSEAFYSILALPYVNVTLDEFTGNNYGTKASVDRSLAVCQYDSTWRTDQLNHNRNTSRGYTLFFPKFMKAQRVYAPTPLANFQRLSFQVLDPEDHVLSKIPDAALISSILFGNSVDASGSCYADPSGEYLFVQLKEWVPAWTFSQLDKVLFAGLTFGGSDAATCALVNWLQRDEGHISIGMSHINDDGTVSDGPNACGYANMVVIRNRFTDPSTGACGLDYFSGSALGDETLAAAVADFPEGYQTGGILNLSRQVQLVLRVVTREFDSATNIRPDNAW